jgi:hypothetical protein
LLNDEVGRRDDPGDTRPRGWFVERVYRWCDAEKFAHPGGVPRFD